MTAERTGRQKAEGQDTTLCRRICWHFLGTGLPSLAMIAISSGAASRECDHVTILVVIVLRPPPGRRWRTTGQALKSSAPAIGKLAKRPETRERKAENNDPLLVGLHDPDGIEIRLYAD